MSFGFDRDRGRGQRELSNNKNLQRKYHLRIVLKDMFRFAEHQEKATSGMGYNFTSTRNVDNFVLNKTNATVVGKSKFNCIERYVPHYTHSIANQAIFFKQIFSKTPPELHYLKRSVFMKEVNTQKLWNFELGTQEGANVPIFKIIGFQQKERQNSQNLKKDTFHRLSVTSAECIIGTENYPDSASFLKFDDDEYSRVYSQNNEASRALTKDDILNPYISDHDFSSSNIGNDIG